MYAGMAIRHPSAGILFWYGGGRWGCRWCWGNVQPKEWSSRAGEAIDQLAKPPELWPKLCLCQRYRYGHSHTFVLERERLINWNIHIQPNFQLCANGQLKIDICAQPPGQAKINIRALDD